MAWKELRVLCCKAVMETRVVGNCCVSLKNVVGHANTPFPLQVKGTESRNVSKLLSKRRFCSIFDRIYNRDFHYFSQN